jgi:hypothetical protein
MGTIETTYDLSRDLTTVKVIGKVSADDFWGWVDEFYAGAVTSLVLWDLVLADLSDMASDTTDNDIMEHVRQVNVAATEVRKGGKTAFVVNDNIRALRLSLRLESLADADSSPFARKTFTSMDKAMEWLGVLDNMTPTLEIDEDRKIIQRTVTGNLFTERSLKLVRELATILNSHSGYNVLMDMRETKSKPERLDLMQIASACAKLSPGLDIKIAFLIPDTEERVRFAQLFKDCMESQGFQFRQFFERDAALEWLTK